MQGAQMPIFVLNPGTKREAGEEARRSNIEAATAVADIIRSTMGPQAMLKMILDPMGGIVMTNDGNAILREIDVSHPAAKAMLELSRAQDEQIGDGTTSVIVLAGSVLRQAQRLLQIGIHPIAITTGFFRALETALEIAPKLAIEVAPSRETIMPCIKTCIGTKFMKRWSKLMCELAYKAVETVASGMKDGEAYIDIKRFAKVEKVPGGTIEECQVLDGVMINKEATEAMESPSLDNPRIALFDCPLEFVKAESQVNTELREASQYSQLLRAEEDFEKKIAQHIISCGVNVVIAEKGISPVVTGALKAAHIVCIRRTRKTDLQRIARVCGAEILNRVFDLQEKYVGTRAKKFEVKNIGDDTFTFIYKSEEPHACTILLRGAAKDVLHEVERNLQDAMAVARNLFMKPKLVPGGGAFEMALRQELLAHVPGDIRGGSESYTAIAEALEVIPQTLLKNCGASVNEKMCTLRARHAHGEPFWGIDGITGEIVDTRERQIVDPLSTKLQVVKSAIENACMLLRIDGLINARHREE